MNHSHIQEKTMSQEQWTAVDNYISKMLLPPDPVLDAALQASDDAGLPNIQVAPNQGKLLMVLAQSIGAKTILEVGTLGGYSTIWLARALPQGGSLITLEIDPKHAGVARSNLANAGFAAMVDVRLGSALDTLPQLAAEGRPPFDLVFIDADKANLATYFEWAMKLTRRGSMIIIDNVVRNGGVIDPNSKDASVQGVRRFNEVLKAEKRVTATAIQTVGSKGYDGLAVALVTGS
jgi:predicted O-methyltransferase YrrM